LEVTLYSQTITFLCSLVLGGIVTGIYLLMEVMREISPPNKIILFAEDMLFTLIVCGLNLFFAIACTQGYIRWYVLAAQITVFAVIYFTLGRLLKKIVKSILNFILLCSGKIKGFFREYVCGEFTKNVAKRKKNKKVAENILKNDN